MSKSVWHICIERLERLGFKPVVKTLDSDLYLIDFDVNGYILWNPKRIHAQYERISDDFRPIRYFDILFHESFSYIIGDSVFIHVRICFPENTSEWGVLQHLYGKGVSVPKPLDVILISGYETILKTQYIMGDRLGDMMINQHMSHSVMSSILSQVVDATVDMLDALESYGRRGETSIETYLDLLQMRADQLSKVGGGVGVFAEASRKLSEIHRLLSKQLSGYDVEYQFTHGDLHLNQFIYNKDGLWITDFTGEPYREPIVERHHYPPLRDLATILNSLTYVSKISGRSLADSEDLMVRKFLRELGMDESRDVELHLLMWRAERAAYEILYEYVMETGLIHVPQYILETVSTRLKKNI